MSDAKNILETSSGYARGAITGGIGGFVLGVLFKSGSLHWWAIGGFLIGGYAGALISEANDSSKKEVFKNYSS